MEIRRALKHLLIPDRVALRPFPAATLDRIEIVADRGISRLVAQSEWDAICRRMEAAFREGRFEAGTLQAIREITALLEQHVPPHPHNPDELPDRPIVIV